jgi:F-type H+-transporting ATPase subunit epsilon
MAAPPIPTSIELKILTPDKLVVNEQVDEVEIPGTLGYFGVLPGHRPMLASLAVGEMWYRKGQDRIYLSLANGFCEVLPDRVTILATLAEKAEEIDVARAEEAKRRAEARLAEARQAHARDIDYDRARLALQKSIARIQVSSRAEFAGRVRHRKLPPPQG